jgi:hypothetical protein
MPTLTLQPNETDAIDTVLALHTPNDNYGTADALYLGVWVNNSERYNLLIKFDLSSLPSNAIISSATLSIYLAQDWASNPGSWQWEVFPVKRAWVENQATWNVYSTGNSWQTPGGIGPNDIDSTAIGSVTVTDTETINAFKDIPLTPTTKAGLEAYGNGWLVKSNATTSLQLYAIYLSAHSTASQRPKLTIVYTEGGGTPVKAIFYARMRQ